MKTQKTSRGSGKMYLKRLKTLRIKAGLKQTEIAEILGIQQTVYSRYERGFQTIPLNFLVKLADFYNTSTDYILNRTNKIILFQMIIFNIIFTNLLTLRIQMIAANRVCAAYLYCCLCNFFLNPISVSR